MADPKCIICNAPNAKLCSSCHSIAYCSPTCQKPDWPLHKSVCKTFADLPPRPTPSHKLAFLFPVDAKNPQLIYIECVRKYEDEDDWQDEWDSPQIANLLEAENLGPKYKGAQEHKPIHRNVLRGVNLGYTVQVICRETFLIDGSTSNECVKHTTKGKMGHDWRGPIVVLRQPTTAIDPKFYEDVKASDLRIAVDYFLSYGNV